MAKKKKNIPQYGTVTRKGVLYYRTRILDADGKQVSLYGTTCEELYDKEQEARRQVATGIACRFLCRNEKSQRGNRQISLTGSIRFNFLR